MARRPWEPEQATQAKPQHRGAPLETFHTFLQVPDGCGACFRISDLGGKPKPCLPAPGDSMRWALSQGQVQSQAPGIGEVCRSITKGPGWGYEGRGP